MRWLSCLTMVVAMGMSACRPAPEPSRVALPAWDPSAVSGEKALAEVAALVALGPRDAGTPGARRAAEHIAARLQALGWEARIETFEDATPYGRVPFHNVVGVRKPLAATPSGRGTPLLLVGSHFDTKAGMGPRFQGANDSGSSTGLLLELARVLAAGPAPAVEIRFVFFDGEECQVQYGSQDGLHGSRHAAAELVAEGRAADVRAVLVLDMIGDRDLQVQVPANGTPALAAAVFAAAEAEGVRRLFRRGRQVLDDQVPFLDAGMPAVLLIDFEYGSQPGLNDYWHTEEDRMDKLDARSLEIVGRVALRVLNALQDPAETPRASRK